MVRSSLALSFSSPSSSPLVNVNFDGYSLGNPRLGRVFIYRLGSIIFAIFGVGYFARVHLFLFCMGSDFHSLVEQVGSVSVG